MSERWLVATVTMCRQNNCYLLLLKDIERRVLVLVAIVRRKCLFTSNVKQSVAMGELHSNETTTETKQQGRGLLQKIS